MKREWPLLGVWGSGAIIPEFEIQPRNDVTELLPYFGSACVLITTVQQCFYLHRRDGVARWNVRQSDGRRCVLPFRSQAAMGKNPDERRG
jgi:hypothetical protein